MLFNYLFVFMIGSVAGFFIELLYRKILYGKWIKPGVFYGFYLPLYGIGGSICYFIYCLNIVLLFKILLVLVFLTLIELVCGVVFIKYFKIPLWDYSKNKFNYKGLICFKYSLYWGILGYICVLFVFSNLDFDLFLCEEVVFVMYLFYSILISDVLYKLFYLFYLKIVKQS